MKDRRHDNRNMCADLLKLCWTVKGDNRSELVSIEDISATGACLRVELPIPLDTPVALHHPKGQYMGKVKYCTCDEIGYLLGVGFDEGYRWSKEDFQPSHLLELHSPD